MKKDRKKISVFPLMTFLIFIAVYPTSYPAIETTIETFLKKGKRIFRFLPNGKPGPPGTNPTFVFKVFETQSLKTVWEFNYTGVCLESSEEGTVEYGINGNQDCFVSYCRKYEKIFGSYKKCLDEIWFKPIPLKNGFEYTIELNEKGHKGKLIFVH